MMKEILQEGKFTVTPEEIAMLQARYANQDPGVEKDLNDIIELGRNRLFFDIDDARAKIAAWVADYNAERPHSSLSYLTPTAYAATFTATDARLRNPDQLRRSPVAPPAPHGVQNPETLTATG